MEYWYKKTPLDGQINEYTEELQLHKVDETRWEADWNKLVNKFHYLGFDSTIGGRIKYFITLGQRIIGAISYCSAIYHLGARDDYIGCNEEARKEIIPHLINNNRFLILPEVKIKNLASRILSMSISQVRQDWEKQYEITPYMAETFVDRERYCGSCYRAANWIYLGVTKGYGKIGKGFVYHGRKKDLYVYIMDRQFAKQIKPAINQIYNERDEITGMINGTPMWYPSLLKELGITDNPTQKITQRFTDHLMRYIPYIGRSENKLHFTTMVQGLLSDLKRKSIEPIAIAFQGVDSVRNLTNFVSRGKWDDGGMANEYRKELSELLSCEDGMITGDETGFPKKGDNSVGVARQYCGSTGKIDNCQSGVMTGYAGIKGYGLVDYELYMPDKWFAANHIDLRKKCCVPADIKFKTKNDILLAMIHKTIQTGFFPAKYIGVDATFGSDSAFLDSLPDNIIYFADIRNNQLVFTSRPGTYIPEYSGKGRKFTKERTCIQPEPVKNVIEYSSEPWEKVVLGIGAKGPVFAEDKCVRVVETRNKMPGKDVWLYARKLEDGTVKYSLCNAPLDSPISEIRKPALMRWSIEQCFKECKDYLGMDHYESRSWDAWRRHILLTFIAHLFIIKLRIEFSRKPNVPNSTPYITKPVSLDDYLSAHMQLANHSIINHPDIFAIPEIKQQFMTIGLIQKLVDAAFPKVGLVVDEVNYLLCKAASAFNSHSLAVVEKVINNQSIIINY